MDVEFIKIVREVIIDLEKRGTREFLFDVARCKSYSTITRGTNLKRNLQFGNYNWRVLDVQDDKVLIITHCFTRRTSFCVPSAAANL